MKLRNKKTGEIKPAEKAVEKLKAWKRLKENKVRFCLLVEDCNIVIRTNISYDTNEEIFNSKIYNDLDLLFGGGE